jgi:hypothetical protein
MTNNLIKMIEAARLKPEIYLVQQRSITVKKSM